MHAGEVQAAQVAGQCVADGQRDHDRATAHPHHRDAVEYHDDGQHHAGQQQVFAVGEGTVGHGAETAAHADQAHLDQREADHQHYYAGDQGGDQAFHERQNARNAHLNERAGNHHTKDRRHHAFYRG
uniref:Histidine-rich protein n=1 Tax=Steinernema glaseri TaxID=37863 RepID=A0A1I7Y2Z2_9BILA